jgi:hypothetical protein
VGTLAALRSALLAMLMMLGAGFTAIVLAVTYDRMFAQLAVTFRTVAGAFGHGFDSCR